MAWTLPNSGGFAGTGAAGRQASLRAHLVGSCRGTLTPSFRGTSTSSVPHNPVPNLQRLHTRASTGQLTDAEPSTSGISEQVTKDLRSAYRSLKTEYDYWITPDLIDGTIPAELTGTLFRNGPGQLDIFGKVLNQPFDGDGMVCSIAFKDGKAFFRNRYVRTKGFVEEQRQGRMLFKGAFATGNPSGGWFYNPFDFTVKNVANTGILYWAGRLFALHESGLPYELDPLTLETLGETSLGGAIKGAGPFAAHYRIVKQPDGTTRWVTFGAAVGGAEAKVSFFEHGDDGRLLHRAEHGLKDAAFGFFHDLAVTERYYILLQNPTKMDFRKLVTEYMLGRCSIAECIKYDPRLPTRIWLIPRPGSGLAETEIKVLDTAPFFSFHHVNAYEVDQNKIVLDTIAWNELDFGMNLEMLAPEYYRGGQRSEMHRMTLNVATGEVARQAISHRCCEFSAVSNSFAGRPYKFAYVPASAIDHTYYWGPNQVLMKVALPEDPTVPFDPSSVKTDIWAPGPRHFTQEPIFVPRAGATEEDDGWLMLLVYNAASQRTDLAILDAKNVTAGPVCNIRLPHHIPPGLHGSWAEVYLGPRNIPEQLPATWQPSFVSEIRH